MEEFKGTGKKFIEQVAMVWPDAQTCLPWPRRRTSKYVSVWWSDRYVDAHVKVCELANGPRPSSRHQAAHSCGNSKCVNPAHLRWATAWENSQDRINHGTQTRGMDVAGSKLTEEDVRFIRANYQKHGSMDARVLAAMFDVHYSNIDCIVRNKTWRGV